MDNICKDCGLPEDLCVCKDLARTSQKITIKVEQRKWKKSYTIVSGFDMKTLQPGEFKQIAKTLKRELACGGTYDPKIGVVELMGEHSERAKKSLIKYGFPPETIQIG